MPQPTKHEWMCHPHPKREFCPWCNPDGWAGMAADAIVSEWRVRERLKEIRGQNMTEIIPHLHQIGAHELDEISNADLVIDMGGIIYLSYAQQLFNQHRDAFKQLLTAPILSFEIDEVDDEPFYQYKEKMKHINRVAAFGSFFVRNKLNVYSLCLAGQNRSGFMSALILINLGYSAKEAVEIIQSKRENALNNKLLREFVLNYQ